MPLVRTAPIAVALFGACLSAAAGLWMQRGNNLQAAADFRQVTERVSEAVESRVWQATYGLQAGIGLYAVLGKVDRSQFRTYVESRHLSREFPGIRGFGFVDRVRRDRLPAYEQAARADGAPGFSVRRLEPQPFDDLYVIRYIEPLQSNVPAMGLDLGSEPVRRQAIERAVDSGLPTLSGTVTLVQDERRGPGFLLFVPVFRQGSDPGSPLERRAGLVGLLYAPIVAAELLAGISDVAVGLLDFELIEPDSSRVVFDSAAGGNAGTSASAMPPQAARYREQQTLELPGRALVLRARSTPSFERTHWDAAPRIVAAIGTLASLLLSGALWVVLRQQASLRWRAERLAQRMTDDLDRLAQVVRHTSNVVVTTDREQRIQWANEAFCRIAGLDASQARGRMLDEVVVIAQGEAAARTAMAEAVAGHEGSRVEVLQRARDGREYWLDLEVQPLRDRRGAITGTLQIGTDVTERKRAEAELKASETLLDRTGQIAGVGGWAVYGDPPAVRWGDQTCRIHGREPGHRPDLQETLDYYAPEARPVIAQAIERCMDSGERFDLELPLVTAAGCTIRVRAVGEREITDGGEVRIVGTLQDVTARHQLEAEVRHTTEVLGSVVENLPCGVTVFDGEMRLVTSNRQFRQLHDLPDSLLDAPATRFEDLVRWYAEHGEYGPGEVDAIVRSVIERALRQELPYQFERERPNGIKMEVRRAAMPGGGWVTTYTDVTERRKAEAETRRSWELLRAAIDALDEGFVLYDPDDRLVFCSDRYRQLYAPIADLIRPGVAFEDMVRASVLRGMIEEARGREEAWIEERMRAHRSGNAHLVQRLASGRTMRVIERRMPDGHTVGFRLDITEIVRTAEAAEAAAAAKGQFLANMSHEIRTPMNAILGMLTLLKRTDLTARQSDYAEKTEGAARSLLGLLDDILDFSKIEAGKMVLDPHPFRPEQLLRDLAVILSVSAAGKPIEILFDIDPALPPVLVGDSRRLQQVLINLGSNAVKFTEHGEVVLSVMVSDHSADSVAIEVAVRDSGIGIPAEQQREIFTGFSQAETSTTRRFGGTGLGLAISRRLVGLMGGELALESAVGCGSVFHFRVEMALGVEDPRRQPLPPVRGEAVRAHRVLLVDDHPAAREVMARMARGLGWTVAVAASGVAAMECIRAAEVPFDAVFIDAGLPGEDAWQTCRRIREQAGGGPGPLVVLCLAHDADPVLQHRKGRPLADALLAKPVTAAMMHEAIGGARAGGAAHAAARHTAAARSSRLSGLRVLVAEDNVNNQLVARELLEAEGARVQIAEDGRRAVEAVLAAVPPFDVVLMDLQMPVMDGYTATACIRALPLHGALPIVAMTANAMPSDREACLAAGMDDHVGKPFGIDHLVTVILRHAGRALPAAPLPTLPPAEAPLPAAARAAAVAAGLDIDSALERLGGRTAIYGRLLRRFVTDLEDCAMPLDELHDGRDPHALQRSLHSLKGMAATIGAVGLARIAATAEACVKAGAPLDEQHGCVDRLRSAIREAQASLDTVCIALEAAEERPPASEDLPQLGVALRTLRNLLETSDLDALRVLEELRGCVPSSARSRLAALEREVELLEFAAAAARCDEWLLEGGA